MRIINLIFLFLIISSCENESIVGDDANYLIGKWKVIAREEISDGKLTCYPDTYSNHVYIEFTLDSVHLISCNRELGKSKYLIDGQQMNVEGLSYIEPCSAHGWIEITARSISFAKSYSLANDQLKINTGIKGEYHLIMNKE